MSAAWRASIGTVAVVTFIVGLTVLIATFPSVMGVVGLTALGLLVVGMIWICMYDVFS